jgi:uncharacterized protein YggE
MKKVLLLALVFLIADAATFAQGQDQIISITGEAIVYATPEMAKVNIPLTAKNSDYTSCSNQLLASYETLSKALEKVGFDKEEIKSTRFNITENYVYRDRERIQDGYTGSMGLVLKMEQTPENMGKLVNVMSQEAFSFGYSIQYELSENQKKELEKEAIEQAVAQAKTNAELILAAAGMKLGYIVNISYGKSSPSYGPLVRRDEAMGVMKSDNQTLEITPEEMEIRQHVDISWSILPMNAPPFNK